MRTSKLHHNDHGIYDDMYDKCVCAYLWHSKVQSTGDFCPLQSNIFSTQIAPFFIQNTVMTLTADLRPASMLSEVLKSHARKSRKNKLLVAVVLHIFQLVWACLVDWLAAIPAFFNNNLFNY